MRTGNLERDPTHSGLSHVGTKYQDVEFHISAAVDASVGHDHEVLLRNLLNDWRSGGDDRHAVIDALYEAPKLEHARHRSVLTHRPERHGDAAHRPTRSTFS